MMSKIANYISSQRFNRDGFAFFMGYTVVALSLLSGFMVIVGFIGLFVFYLLTVSQMEVK